jgi:hypothetical protein
LQVLAHVAADVGGRIADAADGEGAGDHAGENRDGIDPDVDIEFQRFERELRRWRGP